MKQQVSGLAVTETEAEALVSQLVDEAVGKAVEYLEKTFDPQYGGFGQGMKFPRPSTLDLLLRAKGVDRATRTLPMVVATLDGMARGGMRDHLGGGFHRYSTDRTWFLPHFEKMLVSGIQVIVASDAEEEPYIARRLQLCRQDGQRGAEGDSSLPWID